MIFYDKFSTPVGIFSLEADENALLSVGFGDNGKEMNPNNITALAKDELLRYFYEKLRNFTVPYKLNGTEFQKKVWTALTEIPYGKTQSYEDIAVKIGNPKACRAVGMANNKNKLPIIIPCHRVIGKSGSLSGYVGGTDIKEYLLNLEKNSLL